MWSPYDDEQQRLKLELEQQSERDREREQLEPARRKRQQQEQEFLERKRAKEQAELEARGQSGENGNAATSKKPNPKLISPEGKPLTLAYDGYGRPIYVEEWVESSSRPKIWYNYDRSGRRRRMERKLHGIFCEMVPNKNSASPS
jgi:hypothetical protein